MNIINRSQEAAINGHTWTQEDHMALAQEIINLERRVNSIQRLIDEISETSFGYKPAKQTLYVPLTQLIAAMNRYPIPSLFPKTPRDPFGVGARDYNTDSPLDVEHLFQTILKEKGYGQTLTFLADNGKVYYVSINRAKNRKSKHLFCLSVRAGGMVKDFIIKGQSMKTLINKLIDKYGGNKIWGWIKHEP